MLENSKIKFHMTFSSIAITTDKSHSSFVTIAKKDQSLVIAITTLSHLGPAKKAMPVIAGSHYQLNDLNMTSLNRL